MRLRLRLRRVVDRKPRQRGVAGVGLQGGIKGGSGLVAQRANAPRSVYEEAIRLTGERIKNGHATVDLAATLGTPNEERREA